MRLIRLGLKLFLRQTKASSIRILCLAFIIATTAVTSINFFVDSIETHLKEKSATFLGGDLLLRSHQPIEQIFLDKARAYNLQTTSALSTLSMLFANDKLQLASIKAVSSGYPLKGVLEISNAEKKRHITQSIPAPGTVWLEPRLQVTLDAKLGDTIEVGDAELIFTDILHNEPDKAGDIINISPRAMINEKDLTATKLIQPGSRARYFLLISGEAASNYIKWFKSEQRDNLTLYSTDANQTTVDKTIVQARALINLTSIIALLLASITVGFIAHHYMQKQQMTSALLRTFGLSFRDIFWVYIGFFISIAISTSMIGTGLGYLLFIAIGKLMSGFIATELPMPSLWPVYLGMSCSLLLTLGLIIPAVLRLKSVSAKEILSGNQRALPSNTFVTISFAFFAIFTMMYTLTNHLALTDIILRNLISLTLVLFGLLTIAIYGLNKFRHKAPTSIKYLIMRLSQNLTNSNLQIIATSLALCILLIFGLSGRDLIKQWQENIPRYTPNYFAFNINPHQVTPFKAFLKEKNLTATTLYPMVRGRIVAINDVPISKRYKNKRRPNALKRALNMTWQSNLPPHNQITQGTWHSKDTKAAEISVEEGVAHRLGLKLNDILTFKIANDSLTAKVTSFRKVHWDDFKPNFFVIFPPGIIDNYPSNYVTSFYLSNNTVETMTELNRTFPNVTLFDIDDLLERFRSIVSILSMTTSLLFAISLLAAMTIMYAILTASLSERQQEVALLRVFGAKKSFIKKQFGLEFMCYGFLSALIAVPLAILCASQIAEKLFDIHYSIDYHLVVFGFGLSLLIHFFAGVHFYKKVSSMPLTIALK